MTQKRLKVLHVSPSYFPAHAFGGPIQSVHILNKNISQSVDLEIFTTNAGLLENKEIIVNQKTLIDEIPITYFSFLGYEHFNFSIQMFFALIKNVKKFDVVHITAVWNFPVWAASFVCRLYKKPYIVSPRGTIYPETMNMGSSRFKKTYLKWVALPLLKQAKAIHYTADDEKQKVEEYLGLSNGMVIANGLELNFKQKINLSFPQFIPYQDYILFLGRIDKKKGLDILLNAFKSILETHPNIHLVIAGPDSNGYLQVVKQLVDKLKIEKNIIFTGQILGDEKKQLFAHAKMFVLSSYSENFGMAVVEAMLHYCPVIVSNNVGIHEDIAKFEAGIVTNISDLEVANAMKIVLENKIDTEKLIKNAASLLQTKYDIKRIAQEFISEYQRISK